MAFTYLDSLSTNRDKVRLRIGDTKRDAGPRPDKSNFSDKEIAFVLTEESNQVNGAIAHFFEILSNEWSAYALSEKEHDLSMDAKEVADNFRKQALIWRQKPEGASETERSGGLITLQRTDPYTDITEYTT